MEDQNANTDLVNNEQSASTIIEPTEKEKAETQKLLAETAKINTEREQLERPWHKKQDFIKVIIGIITGAGVLAFYINYAVVPFYQKDSLLLATENAKKADQLYKLEKRLSSDSVELENRKYIYDTLRKHADSVASLFDAERKNVKQSNSTIKTVYLIQKDSSKSKVEIQKQVEPLLKKLENQINSFDSIKVTQITKPDFSVSDFAPNDFATSTPASYKLINNGRTLKIYQRSFKGTAASVFDVVYSSPSNSTVVINIYDSNGKLIETINRGYPFSDATSGMYYPVGKYKVEVLQDGIITSTVFTKELGSAH